MRIFLDFCAQHGIESDVEKNFAYLSAWSERGERVQQLTLFGEN